MARLFSSSALVALLAVLLAGSAPASNHGSVRFAECSKAVEPPACLLDLGEPLDDFNQSQILIDVVATGSLGLLSSQRELLLAAAQGRLSSGGRIMDVRSMARFKATQDLMKAVPAEVMLAAIAVAAAAHAFDDPFAAPPVQSYLRPLKGKPEVAQIAAVLWSDMQLWGEWRFKLVRPRGLRAIWRAVAASPPRDTLVLETLATFASYWGAYDEEIALKHALLARDDVSEETRIRVAEAEARKMRARKPKTDADADAEFERMFAACNSVLLENGYQAQWRCQSPLEMLAQASRGENGALVRALLARQRGRLRMIGDTLLRHARGSRESAEYRAIWFSVASEAFRLADDNDAAIAAAREGLPFVEPALLSHWHGAPAPSMKDPERKKRAVANYGPPATGPVVALYRAGARDEALRTGFLSGFERYRNAGIAGEAPDIQWVVEDHTPSVIEQMMEMLLEAPDAQTSERFFAALRCTGSSFYEQHELPKLDASLATLAALAGRRNSMLAHLADAASAADAEARNSFKAQTARELAQQWRRSLIIAERLHARGDVLLPACKP